MIGFPEFILNASKLDERYEEVCIVCFSVFLKILIAVLQF